MNQTMYEKGWREGRMELTCALIEDRFGQVPEAVRLDLERLPAEQMRRLALNVTTAASLADLASLARGGDAPLRSPAVSGEEVSIGRQLTIAIEDAVCSVTPITDARYFRLAQRAIPIFEDYSHLIWLGRAVEREAPDFDHPVLYAALKTLFGESTTAYDDYKCSFGYPFLLKLTRNGRKSGYALNFTDIKGGMNFLFRKILVTPKELDAYEDRSVLREPLEDDFSKAEMAYFTTWFMFYLVGFMESYGPRYHDEYARSLDYCLMIYGFQEGGFFLDAYDDPETFDAAKAF